MVDHYLRPTHSMNQAIIFNDDLSLIEPGTWQVSGFYQGALLTFRIISSITEMDNDTAFDWEAQIEDWLESNEPEQNPIVLNFDAN